MLNHRHVHAFAVHLTDPDHIGLAGEDVDLNRGLFGKDREPKARATMKEPASRS